MHGGKIDLDSDSDPLSTRDDRQLVLNFLLHCGDLSNPMKPFFISKQWATRVVDEFFSQGEKEVANNLPLSPFCDRNNLSLPLSQINFIEIMLAPLVVQMVRVFPQLRPLMESMMDNMVEWGKIYKQEMVDKGTPEKAA